MAYGTTTTCSQTVEVVEQVAMKQNGGKRTEVAMGDVHYVVSLVKLIQQCGTSQAELEKKSH